MKADSPERKVKQLEEANEKIKKYCESFNMASGLKSVEDNLNKIRTQETTLRLEEKQKHLEELCQELEAKTKKQSFFGCFKKNGEKKDREKEEEQKPKEKR